MKKLMIAAAAAALVGGAYADAAYDFVATLKTTKAKQGTTTYTTYNLGMDKDGKFWYRDDEYAKISEANKAKKTISGKEIDSLRIVNGKLKDEGNDDDIAKIIALAAKYDQKSAGQWCCTVKLPTKALCYRVVGTRKIQETFYAASCCTAGKPTELKTADGNGKITPKLLQLFGAQTYEKANKGEIYGDINLPFVSDWNFQGNLAGQGSFGKITDKNGKAGEGPTTINGNIVGVMDAPMCEYCCSEPAKSVAFDCKFDGVTPQELKDTAGFGSFRLKYNRSKSTF